MRTVHYHGQMDAVITSDNSPLYYNLVSRTMGLNSSALDDFYRFFRVSGMGKLRNQCTSSLSQPLESLDLLGFLTNTTYRTLQWR